MAKGRCVICGMIGPLTRDHVPPKAVAQPSLIEINRLPDLLVDVSERPIPRPGYQAPSFPSLCQVCNNERLGRDYDPTLVKLARDVRPWISVIERGLRISTGIQVTTKPLRRARAVVSH